jgi:hypothetical protein
MTPVRNNTAILAYPEVKRSLRALVPDGTWLSRVRSLERDLESRKHYVYSRKGGIDVYFVPLSEPEGYDVIVRRDPRPQGKRRPAWVIEKVIPKSDNKLRQLTPVEKAMLRIIGPLSVR